MKKTLSGAARHRRSGALSTDLLETHRYVTFKR